MLCLYIYSVYLEIHTGSCLYWLNEYHFVSEKTIELGKHTE